MGTSAQTCHAHHLRPGLPGHRVLPRGADQYLAVLGFLLVIPVPWLAGTAGRSGILLTILATVTSVLLPPVILGDDLTRPLLIRIVLLPVITMAITLTTYTGISDDPDKTCAQQ